MVALSRPFCAESVISSPQKPLAWRSATHCRYSLSLFDANGKIWQASRNYPHSLKTRSSVSLSAWKLLAVRWIITKVQKPTRLCALPDIRSFRLVFREKSWGNIRHTWNIDNHVEGILNSSRLYLLAIVAAFGILTTWSQWYQECSFSHS